MTEEQLEFIRKNRDYMTNLELAKHIGMDVDKMRYRLNRLGFKRKNPVRFDWGKHDAYIRANVGKVTGADMARKIGVSKVSLNKYIHKIGLGHKIKRGGFKKGHKPHNKGKKWEDYMTEEKMQSSLRTAFKQQDGAYYCEKYNARIYINSEGYKMMQVDGVYQLLHKHLWEQKNGKYDPNTHCLLNIDGDKLNENPNNWRLITRQEMFVRNMYPDELRELKLLQLKLKNLINEQTDRKKTTK